MAFADLVLRRLALLAATLLVLSFVVAGIMNLLPGDAAEQILGAWAERSGSTLDALRTKLGLDRPWHVRYLGWLEGVLRGDFGRSLALDAPISPILVERLGYSLRLALPAFVLAVVLSLALGTFSALRQGRPTDYTLTVLTLIGVSVPAFVLGPMLILVFSGYLGWLPTSSGLGEGRGGLWLLALILPIATLTIESLAYITRMTRASMIETLKAPYIRMARLKGLPEHRVIAKHALRNGLMPTVTVMAFNFGWLIGGVVVVEHVFNYPGVGSLLLFAIEQRDLPLIQATVFVTAAGYCLANLCADLAYLALNPRIRPA